MAPPTERTPDRVSTDPALSREQKLEQLRDMKYDLKRYATMNETNVDDVEEKVVALRSEIDRVQRDT
ncbi:hypothetical protein [Pseudohoeflea coraliihabitans]|uniref:Uncharacterized protein n=1 Tax=Pseudohoeflea coraliihabitans TaxID=2860393 RepID=A0ABS6WNT4_9HYPH|nr:hypothetical protein [Pseudohoeflea sp. DP4N28-3]MBW3097622.1 hypothetical protein [Pseudohoeflea sp. DP4N28-3]